MAEAWFLELTQACQEKFVLFNFTQNNSWPNLELLTSDGAFRWHELAMWLLGHVSFDHLETPRTVAIFHMIFLWTNSQYQQATVKINKPVPVYLSLKAAYWSINPYFHSGGICETAIQKDRTINCRCEIIVPLSTTAPHMVISDDSSCFSTALVSWVGTTLIKETHGPVGQCLKPQLE